MFKNKFLIAVLNSQVFWKVYTQHNRGHIGHYMARYKIGEVSPDDMATITARTFYDESFYENNPEPYPDLLVNTRYPYNAEGRLRDLTDSWVTPIGKHFVRNHCHVPDIDPKVCLCKGTIFALAFETPVEEFSLKSVTVRKIQFTNWKNWTCNDFAIS